MTVTKWAWTIAALAFAAGTVYFSPTAIVRRARKRGVYVPRQDFEVPVLKRLRSNITRNTNARKG